MNRNYIKPHHIAGTACGLDVLALLSVTGCCESGALPLWGYAVLAPALLAAGVILYQLSMRLYRDDRRRQRRTERAVRLDQIHDRRGA